jgi:DNA-binding transcriptional regulator GbsR (MarR family)
MSAMKKLESSKIREQIDETGRTIEKFGLSPMNGRILALFTVTDSPELTFEEIVTFFNSSKSVISNSLSYLLAHKLIDYKTYNTGRKRYFYLTDRFFIVYFKEVMSAMSELREEVYKTLSKRSPEYPEVSSRILRWVETANLLEEYIGKALDELKKD